MLELFKLLAKADPEKAKELAKQFSKSADKMDKAAKSLSKEKK